MAGYRTLVVIAMPPAMEMMVVSVAKRADATFEVVQAHHLGAVGGRA